MLEIQIQSKVAQIYVHRIPNIALVHYNLSLSVSGRMWRSMHNEAHELSADQPWGPHTYPSSSYKGCRKIRPLSTGSVHMNDKCAQALSILKLIEIRV